MNPARLLQTASPLTFPDKHLERYPWLKQLPRHYQQGKEIGRGAFGIAYHGIACDGKGDRLSDIDLVVKIPLIQSEDRTNEEIRRRLNRIAEKNIEDFFHIGTRLERSPYANPLLDLVDQVVDLEGDKFSTQATVQLFLKNEVDLDRWLRSSGFVAQPVMRDPVTKLISNEGNFLGIPDRIKWAEVALRIGQGIEDFHRRRVTHGDIHPGNVFLGATTVKLIDYGDAFVATPDRNFRARKLHSYLAPERLSRNMLNEQVDIYSFGMLMLYLATGRELITPDRKPGEYRSYVEDEIRNRNRHLLGTTEPRIADLIGRCISRDPADRPRMLDVCETLEEIAKSNGSAIKSDRRPPEEMLQNIANRLAAAREKHSPAVVKLLEQQIRDLEYTFDGLDTEMVELRGTRDQLLRGMVSLFENLGEHDSWTAPTTLPLWQRSALGLGGSYASATIRAVQRGASVRRIFLVSVEELGREFSERLKSLCEQSADATLRSVGGQFKKAIHDYDPLVNERRVLDSIVVDWHRERFVHLLKSLEASIANWGLDRLVLRHTQTSQPIKDLQGLYYGLRVVPTLDDIGAAREDNPVSLMHISSERDLARQWLLVSIEARGRKGKPDDMEKPHLIGLRVFKSVQGRPKDRINHLNNLIRESVDISSVTRELHDLANGASRGVAGRTNSPRPAVFAQ
jgi:serine/threonine protein kinase